MTDDEQDDDGLARDWAAVVRAVEAVQQASSVRLEKMGMSLPYFSVLTLLLEAADNRSPMSRIARDLSMTSGGFTKLADRMARDGLIDRRGSSGDRRVVFAALTEAGLTRAREADLAYRAFLRDEVLHGVSRADLRTLSDIAQRLGQVPRDPDPEAEQSFDLSARPTDEPERRTRDTDDPAAT
jgi:DNA-binding MarR family transcriptional regulator